MAAHKHDPEYLFEHDEQLKPHHAALAHWLKPASDADIQTTVDALKAKHAAQVHVVNTRKDALAGESASCKGGFLRFLCACPTNVIAIEATNLAPTLQCMARTRAVVRSPIANKATCATQSLRVKCQT